MQCVRQLCLQRVFLMSKFQFQQGDGNFFHVVSAFSDKSSFAGGARGICIRSMRKFESMLHVAFK